MQTLIEKTYKKDNSKISKPDFSSRTGREFLAFYLQTQFKQIINYDKKKHTPIFIEIKDDFIQKFTRRLINEPHKKILIGITGESASGKSTICNELKDSITKFDLPVEILNTDNYFNDISDLIKIHGNFDNLRDNGHDVDSPENFQLELLASDIKKLSQGTDIKSPQYIIDGRGVSAPESIPVKSEKIIIAEGFATMYGDVKDLFDIKVYVDINKKERRRRFFERAAVRNQDQENAKKHWDYVNTASEKYILPLKAQSDIILNGGTCLKYFAEMIHFMHMITNNYDCSKQKIKL